MHKELLRFAKVAVDDPREAFDRLRIKLESHKTKREEGQYQAVESWRDWLTEQTKWDMAPESELLFAEIWKQTRDDLGMASSFGVGHDADRHLALATWLVTTNQLLRTSRDCYRIVETGVGRGILSRVILEAISEKGGAKLWSIDLPPLRDPWFSDSCAAVPHALRSKWTYRRGAALRLLPGVLEEATALDLFIHDSLHTEDHMLREFEVAWPYVVSGGALIADDIDGNRAFSDFFSHAPNVKAFVAAPHEEKRGMFGLALKE